MQTRLGPRVTAWSQRKLNVRSFTKCHRINSGAKIECILSHVYDLNSLIVSRVHGFSSEFEENISLDIFRAHARRAFLSRGHLHVNF